MKNKLILSVMLGALCVLPIISSAEDVTTTSNTAGTDTRQKIEDRREATKKELDAKRESLKSEIDRKKEDFKNEVDDRKTALKNELEEKKNSAVEKIQDRLDKFVGTIVERFNAAIERLETLYTRIESRIAKLDAENINTKKAKELMIVAKAKIETAKTSVLAISMSTTTATSTPTATTTASTTPNIKDRLKSSFNITKAKIEKAKKDIKAAHASLVDVIENLKPGLNKDKSGKTSTSTPTTATTTATSTATTTGSN